MDKYLMLKELSGQLPTIGLQRGVNCPSETIYWDYWDDGEDAPKWESHFKSCAYCRAELVRVGTAMIKAPEPSDAVADRVLESLKQPLDHAKVVLQSIGGNLSQIFSSLSVVPAYRSQGPKALVLVAGGKLAEAEIEVHADVNDQYALFVSIKKCRPRDGVVVQLEQDGEVLRSVVLRAGERGSIGSWMRGCYSLAILPAISGTGPSFYRIQLELK
jgi:hypothetical protein